MVPRRFHQVISERLAQFPAVALLGPRQVGKTTLALQIAAERPSIYLDLEAGADREKLRDPALYLAPLADRLVILDEVHRVPDLFRELRGLIDAGRRAGRRAGRFLLLGSGSLDLLKQSSESLAGRIALCELTPLDTTEIPDDDLERLWIRGGFPESFLAASDAASLTWREHFLRTYLERDIPQLGPRIPAETLRRLWTMLAHAQGSLLNAAQLARSLAVDGKTVARYLDLLVDLLLARRLPPLQANVGKRLVKSPRVYLRDSGIVHALLGLADRETLLGHPVAGASWEGFAMENMLSVTTERTAASFYRTAAGAELDLVLDWPDGTRWVVEIKRGLVPAVGCGFHNACDDLQPHRRYLVYAGRERYEKAGGITVIGLADLCREIAAGQSASRRGSTPPGRP